ncbi:MAG: hypothetical protein QM535_13615 [Limnohabitans sp.]|nr:hypothetical protein [Limnohabitans sp.]
MEKIILFLLLSISISSKAQFKPQYYENGNPKTEIIDPMYVKQGEWIYYDNKNQIIRIDKYSDNKLIERKYFSNNTEIYLENLKDFETKNTILGDRKINGEALIDEKGKLKSISIYYNPKNEILHKKKLKFLKSELKNFAKNYKKTILVF